MRELWRQVSGVQERCGRNTANWRSKEISEATIKLIERSKTVLPQLATIVALLLVSQLGLTLDDLPQRYRDRAQVISAAISRDRANHTLLPLQTAFHSCGTVAEHCRPPAPTTWTCRS